MDLACQTPWGGIFQAEQTGGAGHYDGNKPSQPGEGYLSTSQRRQDGSGAGKDIKKAFISQTHSIPLDMERLYPKFPWDDTAGF